jgi:hypothetical protein
MAARTSRDVLAGVMDDPDLSAGRGLHRIDGGDGGGHVLAGVFVAASHRPREGVDDG